MRMSPVLLPVSRLARAVPLPLAFAFFPLHAEPRSSAVQSQPSAPVDDARTAASSAARLLGSRVRTEQGERIGRVEDILIDWQSGRISGVVVSSGGFLGLGDELSVVPPESLRRVAEREWTLDLSREKLADLPRLARDRSRESERHAAGSSEGARGGIRFPETASDADNTARNRRDRDPAFRVDPLDQGGDRSDVETTARIRSAVVSDDRLSINAKNVKIVTRDGEVTLRGPVATEEEKKIIADLAARHASGRIVNQLDTVGR